MNQVYKEVTEFILLMGIPLPEQQAAYIAEIAYRRGYEDGVRNYAIWKNGELLVGCMQRPLQEVLTEAQKREVPIRY